MTKPCLPEAGVWLANMQAPENLAVAWSGGADSTALLLALYSQGLSPPAWHIDHGWHRESAIHAEILRQQAKEWGIPFYSHRLSLSRGKNCEAEARQARYAVFRRWASEQKIPALCLGHHSGDQAETVFLRLLQGSGVAGCRGMAADRKIGGLRLLRPFLTIPKKMLQEALSRADIDWLEDPSNRDPGLRRNHIRLVIFPRMRQQGVEPEELFSRLSNQAKNLTGRMQVLAGRIDITIQRSSVFVDWQQWKSQPPSIRAMVLQRMTALLLGEGRVMGRRHILLVEFWLNHGGRGGLDLSRSRLFREKDCLHLGR